MVVMWQMNSGYWGIIDLADGGGCAVDVLEVGDAVGVVVKASFTGVGRDDVAHSRCIFVVVSTAK